jgi:hypothetical protein
MSSLLDLVSRQEFFEKLVESSNVLKDVLLFTSKRLRYSKEAISKRIAF